MNILFVYFSHTKIKFNIFYLILILFISGVILGVGISIGFVVISLCSIYCRKKWEHARSLRESGQPLKNRIITRNGNACCIDRSSTSMNQQANHQIAFNEIELAVLCPSTPTPTNNHSNAKVKILNIRKKK